MALRKINGLRRTLAAKRYVGTDAAYIPRGFNGTIALVARTLTVASTTSVHRQVTQRHAIRPQCSHNSLVAEPVG
jgi:hypothetical protein